MTPSVDVGVAKEFTPTQPYLAYCGVSLACSMIILYNVLYIPLILSVFLIGLEERRA